MKLLTEIDAPIAIKELILRAESTKIAVAFWGTEAATNLGINSISKPIKIICNLQSGACNPNEIRKLLKMTPNVEVRTNPRLHAKVYWTPGGTVIGSSNASANGLAREGKELSSWAEANVLTTDSDMLEQTSTWFDEVFNVSSLITDFDLQLADELWKRRQFVRPMVIKKNVGLIETVSNNLNHPIWTHVKITCWRDGLSKDATSRLSAIATSHRAAEEISAYEGWESYLDEGDWTFDFYIESDASITFNKIWKILPYFPSSPDLSLAVIRNNFNPEGLGIVEISEDDLRQLKHTIHHFLGERKHQKLKAQDARNVVFNIREAVEFLNSTKSNQDLNALKSLEMEFETAMKNVYEEAKKIGPAPTIFLRMLKDYGALETARRLVNAPPSETFTTFVLKGRIDLTVESLIVQDRWRRLFPEDILQAAQRRLHS